jgi:hypothetical protein
MPRRTVVFEDEFFERLNDLVPQERSATGVPSRTDLLAYDIPPLMDLLAEDYERFTLPVAGSDLRVLVQRGRFVRGIVLWTELLDDRVRVFDIELDFLCSEPDGSEEM